MRIVLDTNIIVSGFLSPNGPPGHLLAAWLEGEFWLVTSAFQLDELDRVLGYAHLRGRYDPGHIEDFLRNIPARADVITEHLPDLSLSPDPNDNPILATAIASHADLIVSGDKGHMIQLGQVEGIPIITAREAAVRLGVMGD